MRKIKLAIVANNCPWNSLPKKIDELRQWFKPKIELHVHTIHTRYSDIPFMKYPNDLPEMWGVEPGWYDTFVTQLVVGEGYDMVLFLLNLDQWRGKNARGWRKDKDFGPIEMQIAANEHETMSLNGASLGSTFYQYARHEIMHALFMLTKQEDTTHYWWDRHQLEGALAEIDFKNVFTIYRPVKTNRITQKFGESKACVKTDEIGRVITPYKILTKKGWVCPAGYLDFYRSQGQLYHNGYDFAAWHGEPVYFNCTFDGWAQTEKNLDGGLRVNVISNEPVLKCTEPKCNEVHYVKAVYLHLKTQLVNDDQPVTIGDKIGLADSTGASSGDHLHFSIKWCDKDGNGLHKENGVLGCFDPSPYYKETFTLDFKDLEEQALTTKQTIYKTAFSLRNFINMTVFKYFFE